MNCAFDIFTRLPDGKPLWIKTLDNLEEADKYLTRLAQTSPGRYFVYCEKSGIIVEHARDI
jgi:hypothetical protein